MAKSKSKVNIADLGLAILGGAIASKVANLPIPMIPEKAKPAIPLVLGYILMKQKGMAKAAGFGMAVVGGIKTVGAFVPQLGIGEAEQISDYMIEGASDYALNGPSEGMSAATGSYSLAGVDETNPDLFG